MDSVGRLEFPLHSTVCNLCQTEAGAHDQRDSHTSYVLVELPSTVKTGDCAASVLLDVKEIELRQVEPGVFQAVASAAVRCPACRTVHELRQVMSTSSRLLSELLSCECCGGVLGVTEVISRFKDDDDDGACLRIQGRLRCNNCEARSSTAGAHAVHRPGGGHRFAVALSFPGEVRGRVERIAAALGEAIGRDQIFYDKWYSAELARPNLDLYLQRIYRHDSRLLVVFLSSHYERKEWCGLEWRAIRDLIKTRENRRIMLLRLGDGSVNGVLSIDGYLDITSIADQDVASSVLERLSHTHGGGEGID